MHILVLNGSPKGEYSITLQTVKYLQLRFDAHSFEILHVGQKIRALEKDISSAVEMLRRAELILFAYPVYTFIAPSQLHRFIELVKASGVDLSGKFAAQITTSKHFYDVTAHRYIEENCADMGLKYIGGLSSDMDDLLTEKGRGEAEKFFEYTCWCMDNDLFHPRKSHEFKYAPVCASPAADSGNKKGDVVIVTDCEAENTRLQGMIDRFRAVLPYKTRIVNIREYPFRGGCLGCFGCAVSGKCIYKDGFDDFLRSSIQNAQAIVYAFTIRDHSMGARFKLYDDRQFCNGHRTVTMGAPVGYLVSGAYDQERNLQMIIEGRAQVGGNFLAGVATDEADTDGQVDRMAARLAHALDTHFTQPRNFLGIGGMKVFRDLIWLMQGMMKADHKFFKAHGQYDFPQKKWTTMLKMYLVGMLISSPKLKAKMGNSMNEGMIAPYKKLFASLEKEKRSKSV